MVLIEGVCQRVKCETLGAVLGIGCCAILGLTLTSLCYLMVCEIMQMFRMNLVDMSELILTQDDTVDMDSDYSS